VPARFPYLPVVSGRSDASLMPLVPLELRFKDGAPVQVHGLLDSGATVNGASRSQPRGWARCCGIERSSSRLMTSRITNARVI
jgi:hypothetical protein